METRKFTGRFWGMDEFVQDLVLQDGHYISESSPGADVAIDTIGPSTTIIQLNGKDVSQ
jgi:hypothetical protein